MADITNNKWFEILLTIRRGEDPKLEDLITALHLADSNIPGEAQLYLAELLDEIDRRGQ